MDPKFARHVQLQIQLQQGKPAMAKLGRLMLKWGV